jgi:hypothetical protein
VTAQWTRRAEHLEEEEGAWAAAEGAHINCGARHAIGEPGRAGWLVGSPGSRLHCCREGGGGARGRWGWISCLVWSLRIRGAQSDTSTTEFSQAGDGQFVGPVHKSLVLPCPARNGPAGREEQGERRLFFLRDKKKIKFGKGELDGKNSENRYLPPVDRAGGVGPGTSRPSSGREVPRGPLRK